MPPQKINVSYSRKFLKEISRLPEKVVDLVEKRESLFKSDPFDAQLFTHKLHGKEKEVWSFSINRSCRIKFIFLTEDEVLFLEIGTHEIYK